MKIQLQKHKEQLTCIGGNNRQYCHQQFDLGLVIAFHCCSSFRYGLGFGEMDEHGFGQIQFSQIQCDHPLACGLEDSLQEWSLGIISNMATACDCIRNNVLDIERWLESGNYNLDGFDYILVFRLD